MPDLNTTHQEIKDQIETKIGYKVDLYAINAGGEHLCFSAPNNGGGWYSFATKKIFFSADIYQEEYKVYA